MKTLSPLKFIEEISYKKVKNTPFRVWHYYVALFLLLIAPMLLPSTLFQNELFFWIYVAVMSGVWLISRNIGTNLSRNKGLDSILVYRFFAAIPWLVGTVSLGTTLLIAHLDDLSHLFYTGMFWIALVVSIAHVLGIIIHFKMKPTVVKNIKKDDLFQ